MIYTAVKQALAALEHLTYTYEDELSIRSFTLGVDAIKALRPLVREEDHDYKEEA